MEYQHTPVMLKEVVGYLDPKPGENFIDCTLGGGGYSFALAEKIQPGGKVIAIDLDRLAIENAEIEIKRKKIKNIIVVNDNFSNLKEIFLKYSDGLDKDLNGIVFDLGLSSAQLDDRRRGFSFKRDALIDMAYGGGQQDSKIKSTIDILNKKSRLEIERIIRDYGEEKYAKSIAGAIAAARKNKPIRRTSELVDIIKRAAPAGYRNKKIHFATKTFQALRIATNDELDSLKKALLAAVEIIPRGGRIAVVSYHSLEDRIVKRFFREESRDCICPRDLPVCRCGHKAQLALISKKAVKPGQEEIIKNPRARSARLRVAIKL